MTTLGPPAHRGFDTRLAAYCVVVQEDLILLALWDMRARDPGFVPRWTLPGGGVELGEQTDAAAVREVEEETGYQVRIDRLLTVDTGLIPAHKRYGATEHPLQTAAVLYAATVSGGELRFEADGTTSEAAWFPLDAIGSLNRVDRVDTAIKLYRETVNHESCR
ncbi:NUDIX hydrolase [Paeniglutamicibacter antarcticus]|uniref:Nudix hydrolase domain-containing protein n=1 Tax=Paeniglutamicibacter antarcticus TaxID=494023 RepID=A0ABP9TSH0_9MICC